MLKLPHMKFVEFGTKDGLTLPGLLYQAKDSKKIAIFLHGNGSSSVFYDESENKDLPIELNKKRISLLKFNNRGAHIIKKLNVKKTEEVDRKKFGCAYERIRDCVLDIDAAVGFLQKFGYKEFYLIGASTGANKICVYNFYRPKNIFKKYILIAGGDDTGIYYSLLGKAKFYRLLEISKRKIKNGQGEDIIKQLLPDKIFSYQAFYDIANPDGDYNCFPFSEVLTKTKLSTKSIFRYYKSIKKPTLVIYGDSDEYAARNIHKVLKILKTYQPDFKYITVKNADHGFTGRKKKLAGEISNWI